MRRRRQTVLVLVAAFAVAAAAVAAGAAVPLPARPAADGAAVLQPAVLAPAASLLPAGSESRFHDWTAAGYAAGKRAIPTQVGAGVFDVTAFGAKPNTTRLADDAVQAALNETLKAGGVVYFPAGRYRLSKPLFANASNIVFRGAGQAATRLVFTRPLADVYGVQYGVDPCTGELFNIWEGGAFITFDGSLKRPPRRQLATVASGASVSPGDTRLPVSSTANFTVGQWVELRLDDNSTVKPPACTGYNYPLSKRAAPSNPGGPRLSVQRVPEWARKDPILRQAMQAGQEAARAGDGGLSVAAAAEIDARHRAAMGGQLVSAAADANTVAAWVYGDNLADSGGPGTIQPGTVRFLFQVKSIGEGYVESDRPIILAVRPGWQAVINLWQPAITNVGVEDMTISFKDSGRYEGHFSDRGYNAINMQYVANAWVRRTTILNADNNIFLARAEFTKIADVVFATGDRTIADGKNMNGHKGIQLKSSCQNVHMTRFNIASRFYHDIQIESSDAMNVFSNGRGADLNLEHHRAAPLANLFSNIDFGNNTRPFQSGGPSGRGAYSGRANTFYNLGPGSRAANQTITLPSCTFGPLLTFVLKSRSGSNCSSMGWSVGTWKSSMPANLHQAQLEVMWYGAWRS